NDLAGVDGHVMPRLTRDLQKRRPEPERTTPAHRLVRRLLWDILTAVSLRKKRSALYPAAADGHKRRRPDGLPVRHLVEQAPGAEQPIAHEPQPNGTAVGPVHGNLVLARFARALRKHAHTLP